MRDSEQPKDRLRISQVLLNLSESGKNHPHVSFKYILEALGQRALGIGIVLFALPSALPLSAIPGFSLLFSSPIIFFAWQLIIARKTLWLPQKIANKQIATPALSHIIEIASPYIIKVERLLKPRWIMLSSGIVERIHGIILLCLVLLLCMPIPLSNFFFAFIIILFGLGISEKDGLILMTAYTFAFTYLSFLTSVFWKIFEIVKPWP